MTGLLEVLAESKASVLTVGALIAAVGAGFISGIGAYRSLNGRIKKLEEKGEDDAGS